MHDGMRNGTYNATDDAVPNTTPRGGLLRASGADAPGGPPAASARSVSADDGTGRPPTGRRAKRHPGRRGSAPSR